MFLNADLSHFYFIHSLTAPVDSSATLVRRRVRCVLLDWQSYRRVCPCRLLLQRVLPIKTPLWLHF